MKLTLLACSAVSLLVSCASTSRQSFEDDANRFCEIHKVSAWEKDGRLQVLNQLDPSERLAELTRAIRATVKTPEMQKIIFKQGRTLPAEEFYPFLQKAIPQLTGHPFECPAVPEFYISE